MINIDKEVIAKNISAFFKYQRKYGYGFSQPDIAKETGLTQQQVSHYENGKMIPSLPAIIAIADMFDVSIDYLVGRCQNSRAHKTIKVTKYRED